MPKKTKKEKLLALYHRKLSLLENKPITPKAAVTDPSPSPTSVEKPAVEKVIETTEDKQLNQYFFSDLKKSLILIVMIIGLEVSLYFVHLVK